MPKLITTRGVVYTTPVTDDKGKPLTETVKYAGRDVVRPSVDHHRKLAGEIIDVSPQIAKELIAGKHARAYDPTIDGGDEGDPLA